RALNALSAGQRNALILVSASGFSYEEAASICGCAVGTIKSRVARARDTLLQILEGHTPAPAQQAGDEEEEDLTPAATLGAQGNRVLSTTLREGAAGL
ncbi:MAG TPA: sigma factor-like helix-turn-helix DNA-binding protein, partial [Steroidobacteraceae bacterium]